MFWKCLLILQNAWQTLWYCKSYLEAFWQVLCTESVPNTTISDQPFASVCPVFVKCTVLGLMDASLERNFLPWRLLIIALKGIHLLRSLPLPPSHHLFLFFSPSLSPPLYAMPSCQQGGGSGEGFGREKTAGPLGCVITSSDKGGLDPIFSASQTLIWLGSLVQTWAKRRWVGCVIPRPGFLWRWGCVYYWVHEACYAGDQLRRKKLSQKLSWELSWVSLH